jgi:hypothetical protein
MRVIIDRFEGQYAVVELPDGRAVNVPRELFEGGKEGDYYFISKDESGTVEARNRIQSKFDRLKKT